VASIVTRTLASHPSPDLADEPRNCLRKIDTPGFGIVVVVELVVVVVVAAGRVVVVDVVVAGGLVVVDWVGAVAGVVGVVSGEATVAMSRDVDVAAAVTSVRMSRAVVVVVLSGIPSTRSLRDTSVIGETVNEPARDERPSTAVSSPPRPLTSTAVPIAISTTNAIAPRAHRLTRSACP
jgi:hypothetical protein